MLLPGINKTLLTDLEVKFLRLILGEKYNQYSTPTPPLPHNPIFNEKIEVDTRNNRFKDFGGDGFFKNYIAKSADYSSVPNLPASQWP